MAWTPISGTVPQYQTSTGALASGYYLKFYKSGTTTAFNMATDSAGGTTLDKSQLDSSGYPTTDGSTRFIPHANQKYKIVLYKNATDADANTTGNADWVIDAIDQVQVDTTDAWVLFSGTPTQTSATKFTLTGDQTSTFTVGTRIKADDSSTLYGIVKTSAYTTLTTITVTLDSGSLSGSLSAVYTGLSTTVGQEISTETVIYNARQSGSINYNLKSKLSEVVSIKDFGAVGDGATDDTTKIQSALDYSNTVGTGEITTIVIPDGVFLTSSLTIYSHTRIIIYGTILKKAANVYLFTNNDYADAGTDEHIYIEGSGIIDCNWDAHTTLNGGTVANPLLEGIRFAGLQYSHVKGIFFEGLASTGIMLKYGGGCSDYRVEGCSFYRAGDATNTGNALFLKGSNGVANGNTFRDIYDTPIGWERLSLGATCGNVMTNCGNGIGVTLDSADVTISGNVIEGCSAHGIVIDILSGAGGTYTSRVTITGNTILNSGEDGSGNGILIDGADNCTVIGNVIDNAGTHGVSVANADNVIISGNTVTNAATQGITCATGSFTVTNNIIFDNNPSDTGTNFGIRVDTATDLIATGNQIYDTNTGAPKQRGIYIGSGVGTAITMANNLHDLAGTTLTNLATTALDTGYISDTSKYLGTFQAADVGAGPTTDDIRNALRTSGLMA